MFEEIKESEFQPFFDLMGEVELGTHYRKTSPEHVEWVRNKIHVHYLRGVRFFAYYDEKREPMGFFGLLIEKGPSDLRHLHQKSELMDIVIFPGYRGQGTGKLMLDHAEQISRNEGLFCMYMSTYAKDHKVINFYGQNGFVPVATLPDVHGPGDEGMVFMRKLLK